MNDRIKEIRATLKQVRYQIALEHAGAAAPYFKDAMERLTNAVDVLTGEVERLDGELLDVSKTCGRGELLWQKHILKLTNAIERLDAHAQKTDHALVAMRDALAILGDAFKELLRP